MSKSISPTITAITDRLNRARGSLLGLACGDAVGTSAEFAPRGSFVPMTDMVGGGPFDLVAGQWTDDTSMMLCLASSLIENGFDLHDQMNRYVRWNDEGYMSSNGRCFDIGNATYDALMTFKRTGIAIAGSTDPDSSGNGGIMRLVPIPIHYLDTPLLALDLCVEQSRTTHQSPECLMACRLLGEVLIRALQGKSKVEVLAPSQQLLSLSAGLMSIACGQYKTKTRDQIRGSGYVVDSLEAAFWCFWNTENFKDCILLAANLGDDADTTAAISGQIAGAYYGQSGIPVEWLKKLTMADEIGAMAEQLVKGDCDSKCGSVKDQSIELSYQSIHQGGVMFSDSLIDAATRQAYLETHYYVHGDVPMTLHVGAASEPLAAFYKIMQVNCCTFITACNPYSQSLNDSDNAKRHQVLAHELRQLDLKFTESIGEHPSNLWPGEPSFLVCGLSVQDSKRLGVKHDQNAIIWCGSDAVPQLILLR